MTLNELKYANIQMEAANELAKQADEFDKAAGLLQIALNRNEPGQPFVKKIAKMMFRFYNRKNKKGQAEAGLLWFRDLETERCGHDIMVDERVLECLRDHFKMRRDELIAELQNITIGGNLNES